MAACPFLAPFQKCKEEKKEKRKGAHHRETFKDALSLLHTGKMTTLGWVCSS